MRRPRERLSSTDRLSRYTTRLSERLTILGCLVGLVLLTELGVLGVTGHALLPAAHDHGPNPGGEEMKPETLEGKEPFRPRRLSFDSFDDLMDSGEAVRCRYF